MAPKHGLAQEDANPHFDWCQKWSDTTQGPNGVDSSSSLPPFNGNMFRSIEAARSQGSHVVVPNTCPNITPQQGIPQPANHSNLPDVKVEQRLIDVLSSPPVCVAPPPVVDDECRYFYDTIASPSRHAHVDQQHDHHHLQVLHQDRMHCFIAAQHYHGDKRPASWCEDDATSQSNKDDQDRNNSTAKKKRRINRPKHNHSKVATDILKQWFATHLDDPFPTDQVKHALSKATQLTVQQISTWFINERKRVLKPLRLANAAALAAEMARSQGSPALLQHRPLGLPDRRQEQ
jgi:hypothetical protein